MRSTQQKESKGFVALCAFIFCLLLPESSYAYLDPGSGNALVYLVVSLAGAALYFLKGAYYKVMGLFSSDGSLRASQRESNLPELALFSEGKSYWPMFKPLIDELLRRGVPFQYYTMDVKDPGLTIDDGKMYSRFLGYGAVAYPRLSHVKARILLVTTPNIGTPGYPVPRPSAVEKLVYVQHGIGDATYLKKGALDHYDVDLEPGAWCENAMRKLEQLRNLRPKEFHATGVLYLDSMIRECRERDTPSLRDQRSRTVLVAPSWGAKSCLHVHGITFIGKLVDAGFEVILRPHPQSFKFENDFITQVIEQYKGRIHVDCSSDAVTSMLRAGMLISDASGIRMDFALTQCRPVLTLLVPKTDLRTFEADALGCTYDEPIAGKIGLVIAPGKEAEDDRILEAVRALISDKTKEKEIRELFDGLVVNQGSCAKAVVDWIEDTLGINKNAEVSANVTNREEER